MIFHKDSDVGLKYIYPTIISNLLYYPKLLEAVGSWNRKACLSIRMKSIELIFGPISQYKSKTRLRFVKNIEIVPRL